ncbi:hypothetical protein Pan153_46290 [Gimesia panareensis]|uniref:Uncharacterized protein n=1 Tax=Gimesia panareensis TaxID=2527978 RepID=A0A518FUE9_9PLAN|nr:hypothetical protein [Gimesia panareensis]QDV19960.1 hypothetical protein Pan153_46290 [Gimesia panareensis]
MTSPLFLYLFFAVFILGTMTMGVWAIYRSFRKDFAKRSHTKYEPQSVWLLRLHRLLTFAAGVIGIGMALYALFKAGDFIESFQQIR